MIDHAEPAVIERGTGYRDGYAMGIEATRS
jgi:hypothetical protein